jgi:LuxR family maltose regulon positive regulatory protein
MDERAVWATFGRTMTMTSHAGTIPAARGGIVSRGALFGLLGRAGRVTQVSAPAGSGKTFLLRAWIAAAGLTDSAAWVPVQREERDPQRFWISVLNALRRTMAGSTLVRPLTAVPDLDGWAVVEGLLTDLEPLRERVWLVIDDAHELSSAEALRQLEVLLMRAPPELRFVLATRHDMRLGLHRLRLEGELTEIRAASLRFTLDEARALFAASGVELPESALTPLHARTEGWAAGLRLAALSLARHPDPERFAAEFSGSERTVAEYLLAEVPERQNEEVWRLLLRTSVLERVSGELADLLTGGSNGERILQDLEDAGAFVVSLDGRRSWFRYHRLFADLLQLELRRSEPGQLPALHMAAADWYVGHGYPAEAERQRALATGARRGSCGSHSRLVEPLTQGETRVLRYLPTNLSAPEIARELSLSVTTVRTHVRHIFAKLGANHRTEAVERARALGLLAPSLALPRAGRTHRFAWDS